MERRALVWLLGAAVLWGTTGTAQALGEAEGSPLSVGAVRLAIGAAGLLVLGWRHLRRTPLRWLAVGAAAMAGYQVAFFAGVARAGVALGTVVAIGSAPVVAGIADWAIRSEPPTRRWWAAWPGRDRRGPHRRAARAVGAGEWRWRWRGVAYAVATAAQVPGRWCPRRRRWRRCSASPPCLRLLPTADLRWLGRPPGQRRVVAGPGRHHYHYVAFARGLRFATVGQAATAGLARPATATLLGVLLIGERPPGGRG